MFSAVGPRLAFGPGAVASVPARQLRSGGPAARLVNALSGHNVRIGPSARAAMLGFVAGAVFWHLVGFWSFIERITFAGPVIEAKALVRQPIQNSAVETGSLPRFESLTRPVGGAKIEPGCTALIRVPSTGLTRDSGCTKLTRPLRDKAASPRRDLAVKRIGNDSSTLITDLPISAFAR